MMVENCIGTVGIPLGVAPTFLINGRHFVVPMCVEEPSVIAAASNAAKLIAESANGFIASSTPSIMTGQIQILDVKDGDFEAAINKIDSHKTELISMANQHCQSMVKRGGGVIDVIARVLKPRNAQRTIQPNGFLVVHFQVWILTC